MSKRSKKNTPDGAGTSAALQLVIVAVVALASSHVVDWPTTLNTLLAVLTTFTSINKAAARRRRCTHCGR